jgi:phosphopantothenoylcysteine decarboxylase/phosphopantothenate--cysteine ligase
VGFAAETNNLDKNAIAKLTNKNCDWIIANDISKKNSGFDSDYNEVTIHYKNYMNKKEKLSFKKKSEISEEIVDRIIAQIN